MNKYEVTVRHHSRDGEGTNIIIPVEAEKFELVEARSMTDGHTLLFWVGDNRVAAFAFWNNVMEVKEWTNQT